MQDDKLRTAAEALDIAATEVIDIDDHYFRIEVDDMGAFCTALNVLGVAVPVEELAEVIRIAINDHCIETDNGKIEITLWDYIASRLVALGVPVPVGREAVGKCLYDRFVEVHGDLPTREQDLFLQDYADALLALFGAQGTGESKP